MAPMKRPSSAAFATRPGQSGTRTIYWTTDYRNTSWRYGDVHRHRLADMLSDLAADYEREQPTTPWPDAYARAILAQFG